MPHPLDDPVRAALETVHAGFRRQQGQAMTYVDDVATFCSVPVEARAADWAGLAGLLGPGGFADMFCGAATPPASWEPLFGFPGLQMTYAGPPVERPRGRVEVRDLGPRDVRSMQTLVATTRPGPFWPRTFEMGDYIGIRDGRRLVAMAGERLRCTGWTEISGVCVSPSHTGRGLASLLVRTLLARIRTAGDEPFLHLEEGNVPARRLYDHLGFVVRRPVRFHGYRVPDS